MNFSHHDIMTFQCVRNMEFDTKGVTLGNIISYWDYMDHSIPAYEEVVPSLAKLVALGVIQKEGDSWKCAPHLIAAIEKLFNGRKTIKGSEEFKWMHNYLAEKFGDLPSTTLDLAAFPDPETFKAAIQTYINNF
ncbi:hypothetical protein ACHMWN_08995 [Pedobacter sp. UC225_61]|uniref:hypothetical protein n=1 Tax=Pedobacter sp. UC225_61 TaxID=3374623 RepID=UPI0037B1D987